MAVKAIPEGAQSVTPYLIVRGAARAIEFYTKVMGAVVLKRYDAPEGKVGHAELKIGNAMLMLGDEFPEMDALSPESVGGSPVQLLLYVEDVDAQFRQALAAGAREMRPVADQLYGDRLGTLRDPFGHIWNISTHKEDVSEEEVQRRYQAMQQA